MEFIIFKVVLALVFVIFAICSYYWLTTSIYGNTNYMDIQNLKVLGKELNLGRLNNKLVGLSLDKKAEKLIEGINPKYYSLIDGRIKPILSAEDQSKVQTIARLQQTKHALYNEQTEYLQNEFNKIANKKFGAFTALDILNHELQNPESL